MLILVCLVTGMVYLLFLITPEAPLASVEKARTALGEARKLGAEKHAPELLSSSEQAYERAMKALDEEYERFILFRDYSYVDSNCRIAASLAERAANKTLAGSKKLEISVKARIRELSEMVDHYDPWMNTIPLSQPVRNKFIQGKMWLAEAVVDEQKKNYNEGDEKLKKASLHLNASIAELNIYLQGYFAKYGEWINWFKESVERSKETRTGLIVVDKMARSCSLYKNGKLRKTYAIELGPNWIGDKRFKGDKSTPEGRYRVVKKLDKSHTKYFKALLIDYPNADDRTRFDDNRKNGKIPGNADIGGLIEIHGHGGKGADWTDGCIALKDDDMKELFSHTEVSTPVTIVGSLKPLDKILKN